MMPDRSQGLGASDAAAACGVDPWRTPYQLWAEKTGAAPAVQTTIPMRVGSALEPLLLELTEAELGMPVVDRQRRIQDPNHPLWATIDGRAEEALVEGKTTGFASGWGTEDTDEIPDHYLIQIQHQLRIAGLKLAWVPVLIGNREFRLYQVRADADLQAVVLERELAFWRLVETRTPPPVTTADDALARWPVDDGSRAVADAETYAAWDQLVRVRAQAKAIETEKESLELVLKRQLASATTLVSPEGHTMATWKAQSASRIDVTRLRAERPEIASQYATTSSTRVLRIKT